jgi:hypothetical protein
MRQHGWLHLNRHIGWEKGDLVGLLWQDKIGLLDVGVDSGHYAVGSCGGTNEE